MIVKVNAFGASIIFLQITLRGQKEQERTRKHFEKFSTQMAKISAPFHLFPKSGHFLPIFKKVPEGSPPLPPLVKRLL